MAHMHREARVRRLALCCMILIWIVALGGRASAERFRFQWNARLSASQEYDDNISLRPDDREHDWITRLTPGLVLSLLTEETEARLSYDFSLVQYARNNDLSRGRHFLTLSGFQGIGLAEHVTLDLDTVLRVSEDPFEIGDPGEDVSGRGAASNRQVRATLGGRIHYAFGPQDSLYGGFTYNMLLNEETGVEDRREYMPSAGLQYWLTLRYGLRLDYAFSRANFDVTEDYDDHLGTASFLYRAGPTTEFDLSYTYDHLRYDGLRSGYTVHTVALGMRHQFNPSTSGSLSGGYFVVVPEEGENRGDFSGSVSFTYSRPRSTLSLNGSAGYRRQFFQRENLGLSLFGQASVNFTYQLLERLSAYLTGSYFRDEYLETVEDRETHNWRGGAGLQYVILSWLSGSVGYEHRQRQSNVEDEEYVDNRVTVRFTATYAGAPRPL